MGVDGEFVLYPNRHPFTPHKAGYGVIPVVAVGLEFPIVKYIVRQHSHVYQSVRQLQIVAMIPINQQAVHVHGFKYMQKFPKQDGVEVKGPGPVIIKMLDILPCTVKNHGTGLKCK
jgi:hypothetical protein